ncbi:acetyltransferase [Weissella coleopterorum]|uniref:Acetyltransferase n=1 Tax=Weissella coleopterorum TaxID=2714949 RepID=A0A6G8AYB1_9LACO|nr:acyltransferase family protein [Weissella coleopterorum]QIL50044.1 acetyltransferase [Weissella coleopterorum]
MEQQKAPKRRYITGFDGLRALAVLGVIGFHLWPDRIVGGWLGVPLFFILSGYLITDLLIQEYEQTGHIKVISFWVRRLKRLMPALFTMLLLTSVVIFWYFKPLLYNLRAIISTNLIYIYNFWAIKHGGSYFDQWNHPSPFTHLWSLSIEGQFYLLWPIIVLILMKLKFSRRKIGGGLMLGAAISAILMAILYSSTNLNRVYYGTDTRMFAVLLGTALAFVWPSNRFKLVIKPTVKRSLDLIGWVGLLIVALAIFTLNGQWAFTYYGGMFLITLIMVVLVAITAHPASAFSKILNQSFLRYLGTRSYSIYLYQLPVFVLYSHWIHRPVQLVDIVIELVWVLVLAEISYRYIEKVFKSSRFWHNIPTNGGPQIYAAGLLFLIVSGTHALMLPQTGQQPPKTKLEHRLTKNQQQLKQANRKAQQAEKQANRPVKVEPALLDQYAINEQQYQKLQNLPISAVGDSLLLNAGPNLQKVMPQMTVDAQIGRQVTDVINIIKTLKEQNNLADQVLITSGTNGTVSKDQIKQVMEIVGKHRTVYWVNDFAERNWVAGNNQNLLQVASRHSNLKIVNWDVTAKQHMEWLGRDQVHPNPTGSVEYTKTILRSILKTGKNQ